MNKKHLAAAAAFGVALLATFPYQIACMAATVVSLGAFAMVGAWLVDRFGDLPGGDRRCA